MVSRLIEYIRRRRRITELKRVIRFLRQEIVDTRQHSVLDDDVKTEIILANLKKINALESQILDELGE